MRKMQRVINIRSLGKQPQGTSEYAYPHIFFFLYKRAEININ